MIKEVHKNDNLYYLQYGTRNIYACKVTYVGHGFCSILLTEYGKVFDNIPFCSLYNTYEEANEKMLNS